MHVEHEVDQRALQLRAHAEINGEARAGDLGGALEVENAEFGAQVPMRLGSKVERLRHANAPDFEVIFGRLAGGYGFMRDIRDTREHLAELFVERFGLFVKSRDLAVQFPHGGLASGRVFTGLAKLADFLRFGFAFGSELLGLGDRGAAVGVQFAKCLHVERETTVRQTRGGCIQAGSEDGKIVHFFYDGRA